MKDRKQQQTKLKAHKRKKNIDHKLLSSHKNIKALKQKAKYSIKKFEWPPHMTQNTQHTIENQHKTQKILKPTWNHCIKKVSTLKILT
jgi:hypothetical protein